MTAQYFLFDTYPGCLIQVLPAGLMAGLIYLLSRQPEDLAQRGWGGLLWKTALICYLTGLLCLTALPGNLVGSLWYYLLYHRDGGMSIHCFEFSYNFIPTFLFRFRRENLGNLLMFLPFGLLYRPRQEDRPLLHTVTAGGALSLAIELWQPIVGRSFDVNDLILNTAGAALGAAVRLAAGRLFGWIRQKAGE